MPPHSRSLACRRVRLCLLAASAWRAVGLEGVGDVEIEFAPMDMRGGADPLMEMLAGAGRRPGGMRGPAQGGREAELDNMLAGILNGMIAPGAGRVPVSMGGGPRGNMPPGATGEVILEGPGGATQVIDLSGPSAAKQGGWMTVPQQGNPHPGKSSMPGSLLRDLFPGAMVEGGPMVIEGPTGGVGRPLADPMMMDIMQDLDHSFANEMLPAIQKAARGSGEQDPRACQEDIKTKCASAKSHLHCLGMNHNTVSEACRKEVGQSVPFRCSKAIDKFCDVLQTGILACLYNHMQDVDGDCRDAVLTTKHVINKVNTQKASLVDKSTGATKVSTPAMLQDTSKNNAALSAKETKDKEARLDAKLGLSAFSPAAAAEFARSYAAPPPVAPHQMSAVAGQRAQALPRPNFELEPEAGWLPNVHGYFIIFAIFIAFAAYLLAFTDYTQTVDSVLRGESLEGAKLVHGMELLRPDAL